ncbi:uncharacterized protein VTP21DRAFT_4241 [Calcarisporiella thermophila]|uniref:uncharacterized protein n=1 Tax=Calcarisporiella thermophila TaxID=911321 RepID=UPI0037442976
MASEHSSTHSTSYITPTASALSSSSATSSSASPSVISALSSPPSLLLPAAIWRKQKSNEFPRSLHSTNENTQNGTDDDCDSFSPDDELGDSWRDVCQNIKRMDQLYDATFFSWVKSEDNVLITSMYLYRIANEYPLARIANALKWLVADWRLDNICHLVRHVTLDWTGTLGDVQKANLLRHLTKNWAMQYTANMLTSLLSLLPYNIDAGDGKALGRKEYFLRVFVRDWNFSKLSEFFMHFGARAGIPHRTKCLMLQEAARRDNSAFSDKIKRLVRHRLDLADELALTAAVQESSLLKNPIVDEDINSRINIAPRRQLEEVSIGTDRELHDRLNLVETSSSNCNGNAYGARMLRLTSSRSPSPSPSPASPTSSSSPVSSMTGSPAQNPPPSSPSLGARRSFTCCPLSPPIGAEASNVCNSDTASINSIASCTLASSSTSSPPTHAPPSNSISPTSRFYDYERHHHYFHYHHHHHNYNYSYQRRNSLTLEFSTAENGAYCEGSNSIEELETRDRDAKDTREDESIQPTGKSLKDSEGGAGTGKIYKDPENGAGTGSMPGRGRATIGA